MLLFILAAAAVCADTSTAAGMRLVDNGATACPVKPESVEPPLRPSTAVERSRVLRYFSEGLKDAPSARWQWRGTWRGGWVCGQVNAKNSFGTYSGWQWFAYHDGYAHLVDDRRTPNLIMTKIPCLLPQLVSWDDIHH